MNTLEGNKLIADFLGGIEFNINKGVWQKVTIGSVRTIGKNLRYHTSWDWLMLCVDKIEILHESNNVLIGTNLTYIQVHNKALNEQETFKGVDNSKLEATYKAVLEFIQWYNTQNKQP